MERERLYQWLANRGRMHREQRDNTRQKESSSYHGEERTVGRRRQHRRMNMKRLLVLGTGRKMYL